MIPFDLYSHPCTVPLHNTCRAHLCRQWDVIEITVFLPSLHHKRHLYLPLCPLMNHSLLGTPRLWFVHSCGFVEGSRCQRTETSCQQTAWSHTIDLPFMWVSHPGSRFFRPSKPWDDSIPGWHPGYTLMRAPESKPSN